MPYLTVARSLLVGTLLTTLPFSSSLSAPTNGTRFVDQNTSLKRRRVDEIKDGESKDEESAPPSKKRKPAINKKQPKTARYRRERKRLEKDPKRLKRDRKYHNGWSKAKRLEDAGVIGAVARFHEQWEKDNPDWTTKQKKPHYAPASEQPLSAAGPVTHVNPLEVETLSAIDKKQVKKKLEKNYKHLWYKAKKRKLKEESGALEQLHEECEKDHSRTLDRPRDDSASEQPLLTADPVDTGGIPPPISIEDGVIISLSAG